jgi:hypothetical protein
VQWDRGSGNATPVAIVDKKSAVGDITESGTGMGRLLTEHFGGN